MPDNAEILKNLLASLSPEDLAALLKQTEEDNKPKGPKKSAILGSNVIFDNSGWESMRKDIDKKIPLDERPYLEEDKTRSAPAPRDGIEKVDVTCDRCRNRDRVYSNQITGLSDGKAVYLCIACSEKIRT